MAGYTITQGASFFRSFSETDITFDDTWSGVWAILDNVGGTVIEQGTLTESTDSLKLLLRIKDTDTDDIPVGNYVLVVEISNSVTGYSSEVIRDLFIIQKQGIA